MKTAALGHNCDRFLFGWGQGPELPLGSDLWASLPEKFLLTVLDENGDTVKQQWEVQGSSIWYVRWLLMEAFFVINSESLEIIGDHASRSTDQPIDRKKL